MNESLKHKGCLDSTTFHLVRSHGQILPVKKVSPFISMLLICFTLISLMIVSMADLSMADENIFWIETGSYPLSKPGRIAFMDDGKSLAVLNNLNQGRVTLIKDNFAVAEQVVGIRPYDIAADNGKIFISNLGSNSVTVLSQNDLSEITTIQTNNTPANICFSSDGSKLFVSCSGAGIIEVINTETLEIENSIYDDKTVMPSSLIVHDGRLFVADSAESALTVFSEESAKTELMPEREAWIALPGMPTDLSIAESENKLYVSSQSENEIYIINLNTLKLSDKEISVNGTPGLMVYDGNRYVYLLNNERRGSVYRLDSKTDLITKDFFSTDSYPCAGVISPAGDLFYAVSSESDSVTYHFFEGGIIPSPEESILKPGESVDLSITGGSGNYKWSVQAGTLNKYEGETVTYTAPDIGGVFNVTVEDTESKSVAEFIINVNNLLLNPGKIAVSNRAPVTFNVTGGTPPYSFETQGGGTYERSESDQHVCYFTPSESAGVYTLLVKDKNNFTDTAEITYMAMSLAISPKRVTMAPDTEKSFSITGGIPPYTVTYGTGACSHCQDITQSGSRIEFTSSRNAGETFLRVFDSTGASETALISVYDGLFVSPAHLYLPVSTTGKLEIIGGIPGYEITTTSGTYTLEGNTINFTGNVITEDKEIELKVTDANGKNFTVLITVTGKLSVSPGNIDTSSMGETHRIMVSGGTVDYTWFAQAGAVRQISENEFLYTAPQSFGSYTVEFQDSAGTTKSVSVNVVNDNLILSPSNIVLYPGEHISFTVIGGVAPYDFSYETGSMKSNGNQAIFEAPDLSGNFQITVSDQSGLEYKADVTVVAPIELNTAVSYVNPGETIQIEVQGGAGGYQFTAQSGELSATRGSKLLYSAPDRIGTYWLRATDALSNTASCMIVVGDAPIISPSYAFIKPSGSFTFKVQKGFPPYTIKVDAGEPPVSTGQGLYQYTAPVTKGIYHITATDSTGLTTQMTVETGDSDVIITPGEISLCSGEAGFFEIKGGKAPYKVTAEVGSLTESGQGRYRYEAPEQADLTGEFFLKVEDANENRASGVVNIQPQNPDNESCIEMNENLSIKIPCAMYGTVFYGFTLNFHPLPEPESYEDADADADPAPAKVHGLIWKMDFSTFSVIDENYIQKNEEQEFIQISDTLDLTIPCAEYLVHKYGFELNLYHNPKDAEGIYFELDLSTLKSID